MFNIVFFRKKDEKVLKSKVFEKYFFSLTIEVTISKRMVQKVLINLFKRASHLDYFKYVFYLISV